MIPITLKSKCFDIKDLNERRHCNYNNIIDT